MNSQPDDQFGFKKTKTAFIVKEQPRPTYKITYNIITYIYIYLYINTYDIIKDYK